MRAQGPQKNWRGKATSLHLFVVSGFSPDREQVRLKADTTYE